VKYTLLLYKVAIQNYEKRSYSEHKNIQESVSIIISPFSLFWKIEGTYCRFLWSPCCMWLYIPCYQLLNDLLLYYYKQKSKLRGLSLRANYTDLSSDRRLSAKLVPTFADRWCHVVSVTDPYGRILGFLDWSRYYFFQVDPQLYSRGWVDLVPDPLLLKNIYCCYYYLIELQKGFYPVAVVLK
jgi:hypothetical protein